MNTFNKIMISVENARKVQEHRYFISNSELNKTIYDKTITLLGFAYKNNSNEALLLFDDETFEYEYTTQNLVDTVCFNNNMIFKLTDVSNSKTYTAIHNHPTDASFSIGDLNQLMIYKKMSTLVLITNSCKYSAILYKTTRLTNIIQYKIISKVLEVLLKYKIVSYHRDATKLIRKLQQYGLEYMYFQNY